MLRKWVSWTCGILKGKKFRIAIINLKFVKLLKASIYENCQRL